MNYPWLQRSWQQLTGLGERLAHALLFVGPAGLGKRELAEAFAAHLLCRAPGADGMACGRCSACVLREGGNHPDLVVVSPADSARVDEAAVDGAARRQSGQIVIEQIRALQHSLTVTGHQSERRVVIIDPADAMNVFTANALLKLLEEPPAGCVLLLISSLPRRLLPTIRSRCQQWQFAPPDAALGRRWLEQRTPDAMPLLALCGGMPLAAERLARQGAGRCLAQFEHDVAGSALADPVQLAGTWDKWLKSKEAAACGLDLQRLVDWMFRWVCDLAMLAMGGQVRYFPTREAVLQRLAAGLEPAAATACYNDLMRIHRVVQHPLNTRLVLEDMLLRYACVVKGVRP